MGKAEGLWELFIFLRYGAYRRRVTRKDSPGIHRYRVLSFFEFQAEGGALGYITAKGGRPG